MAEEITIVFLDRDYYLYIYLYYYFAKYNDNSLLSLDFFIIFQFQILSIIFLDEVILIRFIL